MVCSKMGAPRGFQEQTARTSKEWKWQRGIVTHPLSESQWNRCHFCTKNGESENHKSWGMPAEGFKGHVDREERSPAGGSIEASRYQTFMAGGM